MIWVLIRRICQKVHFLTFRIYWYYSTGWAGISSLCYQCLASLDLTQNVTLGELCVMEEWAETSKQMKTILFLLPFLKWVISQVILT